MVSIASRLLRDDLVVELLRSGHGQVRPDQAGVFLDRMTQFEALFVGDHLLLHPLREVLIEREHPRAATGLHEGRDLVVLALTDQVPDRRRREHDLGDDRAALAVGPRRERLGDDALQRGRELGADLLLLVRREDVDDAVDRLRRALRVQRREHEVAGLGRGQRGRRRLEVTQLADQDDVGVLAQRVLERHRERVGVLDRPRAG